MKTGSLFLVSLFAVSAFGQTKTALPDGAIQRLGPSAYRPGSLVRDLAYSADGRYLVNAGSRMITLMEASSGETLRHWPHYYPAGVFFTPDSDGLIVAG